MKVKMKPTQFARCAGMVLACASALTWSSALAAQEHRDYQRDRSGVSGRIVSIGSDTLNNLMTEWAEHFRNLYPSTTTEIQGLGSSTAPPALINGTSNIGPMSRKMKARELEKFEEAYGYRPLEVPVAVDALAVFVHRDNPLRGMSIQQVDAVFSATRKCGSGRKVSRWGKLGAEGRSWQRRRISLYGRNSVSGTYGYFKKVALCNGDFSKKVNEQSGSAGVVQAVANTLGGIGYSGIGYRTSGVRAIPLSKEPGGEFVSATAENAADGSYPLSRFLYVYVNKKPNQPLNKPEREFLTMVLSSPGQQIVQKNGYVPLPTDVAAEAIRRLSARR